jgi:AraC-like DNA-binding protein
MLLPHPRLEGLALFTSALAKHQHDLHAHGALAVIQLTQGAKSYRVEGQRMPVYDGQIAIANPGELHGCEYVDQKPWAHRTWYASAALIEALSLELGFSARAEIGEPVVDDTATCRQMRHLHERAQQQAGNPTDDADELDQECAALLGLAHMLNTHGHAPRTPRRSGRPERLDDAQRRVTKCVDIVRATPTAPLGLAALAQEVGVSRFQVIRDFVRVMRMTPGDYLRTVRMELAKSLLATARTIGDVAMAAGYSDQSHFSRVFRKVYGITPMAYAVLVRQRPWMDML